MKKVLLEDHSEAMPPKAKKNRVIIYISDDSLAALENYRLFEMGMARKYRTLGQAIDAMLDKHSFHLKTSDYFKALWLSTVVKGRKVMDKYIARKELKEKQNLKGD